jgi:hypothetical protein
MLAVVCVFNFSRVKDKAVKTHERGNCECSEENAREFMMQESDMTRQLEQ